MATIQLQLLTSYYRGFGDGTGTGHGHDENNGSSEPDDLQHGCCYIVVLTDDIHGVGGGIAGNGGAGSSVCSGYGAGESSSAGTRRCNGGCADFDTAWPK